MHAPKCTHVVSWKSSPGNCLKVLPCHHFLCMQSKISNCMPHYDKHWHTHSTPFITPFTGLQWYMYCMHDSWHTSFWDSFNFLGQYHLSSLPCCFKQLLEGRLLPLGIQPVAQALVLLLPGLIEFISLNNSINLTVRYVKLTNKHLPVSRQCARHIHEFLRGGAVWRPLTSTL